MDTKSLDLDVIPRFLELSEERKKQIQENGRGTYAFLVPEPLDPALLKQFPELHQMPPPISIEHQGKQFLIPQNISGGLFSVLDEIQGTIWIPFEIVTDEGILPIEQYLSKIEPGQSAQNHL